MPTSFSKDTLNKETDARFWAQTGYKPGQKLDPANPTDKAMSAVWLDILRKVQREANAGTLVTTFDQPHVDQRLSDAAVADKAAAAHLDMAAAAPDAATARENVTAATTAAQISAQKAREAAASQPQVVSSDAARGAAKEAAKSPPPPSAPAADHIAHARAQTPPPRAPVPPREVLYKETNARFWMQTRYKPGQILDMENAQDREQAKVWMKILHQVEREASEGKLIFTSPELTPGRPPRMPQPPSMQPPPYGQPPMMPQPPAYGRPPMMPQAPPYGQPPMMPPPPAYGRPPMMPQAPYGRPPMMPQPPPYGQPPMMPQAPAYGRPPMMPQPPPLPGQPSMTAPPGPATSQPPIQPVSAPSVPGPTPASPESSSSPSDAPEPPAPGKSSSIGKYVALGVAALAGGGLIYYATTRKPSRASSPRTRTPKVLLATPARARRVTPLRGVPAAFPPTPPLRP